MILYLLLGALTLLTAGWLVSPLWRTQRQRITERDARLAVLRDRRAEIDRELAQGRLSEAAAQDARSELLATLASEAPDDAPATAHASGPRPWLAGAIALFVTLVAGGVYLEVGEPRIDSRLAAAAQPARAGTPAGQDAATELAGMLNELQQRVAANPDDGEAQAMLAQIYSYQNQLGPAMQAYEKAIGLLPPNARLLADYAEVVALGNNTDFSGRPTALLRQALAVDPGDPKANALMGAALMRAGQPAQALPHLEKILALVDPASDQGRQIAAVVADLRAKAGVAPVAAATDPTPPGPPAAQAAATPLLRGTITLAGASPPEGASLFVLARAAEGPRMPYAARRIPVPSFPFAFDLGAADLMSPQRPFDPAVPVVVEARISLSGQAMRQPGDRFGTSEAVQAGAGDIRLVIDQVVP